MQFTFSLGVVEHFHLLPEIDPGQMLDVLADLFEILQILPYERRV